MLVNFLFAKLQLSSAILPFIKIKKVNFLLFGLEKQEINLINAQFPLILKVSSVVCYIR